MVLREIRGAAHDIHSLLFESNHGDFKQSCANFVVFDTIEEAEKAGFVLMDFIVRKVFAGCDTAHCLAGFPSQEQSHSGAGEEGIDFCVEKFFALGDERLDIIGRVFVQLQRQSYKFPPKRVRIRFNDFERLVGS